MLTNVRILTHHSLKVTAFFYLLHGDEAILLATMLFRSRVRIQLPFLRITGYLLCKCLYLLMSWCISEISWSRENSIRSENLAPVVFPNLTLFIYSFSGIWNLSLGDGFYLTCTFGFSIELRLQD